MWTLLDGLQHLDLVAHPDRAFIHYPRADTTATLQCLRHTWFGKSLDVPADRAWPSVFEDNLSNAKPLAASQSLQAHPSNDDVASVLTVLDPHAGLSLDVVEVLRRDKSHFAYPAETAPVPGPHAVAIALQAAAYEGFGRRNAPHLRTSFRSKEYPFHQPRHQSGPPLDLAGSFRKVLQYPITTFDRDPVPPVRSQDAG